MKATLPLTQETFERIKQAALDITADADPMLVDRALASMLRCSKGISNSGTLLDLLPTLKSSMTALSMAGLEFTESMDKTDSTLVANGDGAPEVHQDVPALAPSIESFISPGADAPTTIAVSEQPTTTIPLESPSSSSESSSFASAWNEPPAEEPPVDIIPDTTSSPISAPSRSTDLPIDSECSILPTSGPPVPRPPSLTITNPEQVRRRLQTYLETLGYNYTAIPQFFPINKKSTVRGLALTARTMIQYGLPIRCLEAVILAIYLTHPVVNIDRFTMSFVSTAEGQTYRHIVLAIHHNGKFGAVGLSRRKDLMDKPLTFLSLYNLVQCYAQAYQECGHQLTTVHLSELLPHDAHSHRAIHWKKHSVTIKADANIEEMKIALQVFMIYFRNEKRCPSS